MYCDLYSLDLYRNFVGYARYSYPNGTAFRASTRFARLSGLDSKYSVRKSNYEFELRIQSGSGKG